MGFSRGIDGFALLDRTDRSSTSNVHNDQISFPRRLAQELSHGTKNERVADSVKSVLAQPIRLGDLLVNWVCLHMERHCLVEGRIKERYACHTWKLFLA